MTTLMRLTAALLLVAAASSPAAAAEPAKAEESAKLVADPPPLMQDGSAPPRKPKIDPDTNRPAVVYLAAEGAELYEKPASGAARVTLSEKPESGDGAARAKPVQFMQPFHWCTSVQQDRDSPEYVLLCWANAAGDGVRQHAGWVPARYLVRQPKALGDTNSGIVRKAMIVTQMEELKGKPPAERVKAAPVPREGATELKPFRLFTFFFVYGEADGHVLLGGQPEFEGRKPKEVVLGWVPAARVCPWNTREAVEWDRPSTYPPDKREPNYPPPKEVSVRRTERGRIFAKAEDALTVLKGGAIASDLDETFAAEGSRRHPLCAT